jgi:hypothetical protein
MVHANRDLSEFLASNTTLHVYKQTAEERLLSMYRELNFAKETGTYDQVLTNLRSEAKGTHTPLLKNEHATEFYCRLIKYGKVYEGVKLGLG